MLVPWMWSSSVLALVALGLLVVPATRAREATLAAACAAIIVSVWIDKGLGLIVGGLVPTPLGAVTDYVPTAREMTITAGVWAVGAAMATAFFKITAGVRSADR
jgi:molybdopterin-containing oxidoreductase family membrane subunit